jgi:hypothetical protein
MDDALALLAECTALDLILEHRGDKIGIIGPRVARDAVADRVRACKPALLRLLAPPTLVGCARCGGPITEHYSADGTGWCRRCDNRREMMDLAQAAGFPRFDLRPTMLYVVPAGVGGWTELARRATGATAYVASRRLRQRLANLAAGIKPSDAPVAPWQD